MIRLLEEPTLIQQELDRRLAAAQAADPTKKRTQAVERDLARVGKKHGTAAHRLRGGAAVARATARADAVALRQREQTLRDETS